MAGQTRALALQPRGVNGEAVKSVPFPLKLMGLLDWDKGGFRVDTELK